MPRLVIRRIVAFGFLTSGGGCSWCDLRTARPHGHAGAGIPRGGLLTDACHAADFLFSDQKLFWLGQVPALPVHRRPGGAGWSASSTTADAGDGPSARITIAEVVFPVLNAWHWRGSVLRKQRRCGHENGSYYRVQTSELDPAARFLAASPDWHVLLACRNDWKAQAAIDRCMKSVRRRVGFGPLDLFFSGFVSAPASLLATMDYPPSASWF